MRRRYLIPIAVVAAVVAAFATRGADAQSPPAGKSVTVLGTGTQRVDEPGDRADRAARERATGAGSLRGKLLAPEAVRDLSPPCVVFPAAPPPRRRSRPPRPVVPQPLCLDPGAVAMTVSVTFEAS